MIYIDNWRNRAESHIYQQWKDAPTFRAFALDVFTPEVQELEDALWALRTISSIDASAGAQLDVIGVIVDEPRSSTSDGDYRLRLRAKIRAHRSSGTPDDLYATLRALGAGVMRYEPAGIKTFKIRLFADSVMTASNTPAAVRLVGEAKEAGARAILVGQTASDVASFSFAGGPGLGFGAGMFASARSV